MPDTQLLPRLAAVLNISCDMLFGYYPPVFSSPYEELYQSPEYYWGTQPTELSMKVLAFYPPRDAPSLLDIGCREGQNVLFFGRNGYRTTGVDVSDTGIRKAQLLANKWNIHAELICASVENYTPDQAFDIVFCDDMLHLITPQKPAAPAARVQNAHPPRRNPRDQGPGQKALSPGEAADSGLLPLVLRRPVFPLRGLGNPGGRGNRAHRGAPLQRKANLQLHRGQKPGLTERIPLASFTKFCYNFPLAAPTFTPVPLSTDNRQFETILSLNKTRDRRGITPALCACPWRALFLSKKSASYRKRRKRPSHFRNERRKK